MTSAASKKDGKLKRRSAGKTLQRRSGSAHSRRRKKSLRQRRAGSLQARAKSRLNRFRQASLLAVTLTAFLVLLWEGDAVGQQGATQAEPLDAAASVQQATSTLQGLLSSFYGFLPKIMIAFAIMFIGWLLARLVRTIYRRVADSDGRGESIAALAQIGLYFLAFVIAVSVLAGDVRALLGSLGLVGLALSWALQAPIESFTGWVLNTFRTYYRVGDRIEVGEVFGDVYKIDYLTTTVWEAGGPGKPVSGAQPTGALITFPNSEVLRSNIVNYTRDFPFVWDEITIGLTNETDMTYALNVIRNICDSVIGAQMTDSIREYRRLLVRQRLNYDVEEKPQVYLSLTDAWTNCTVRYLVGARKRRAWSSILIEKLSKELSTQEHKGRIRTAYPRQEVFFGTSPDSVTS